MAMRALRSGSGTWWRGGEGVGARAQQTGGGAPPPRTHLDLARHAAERGFVDGAALVGGADDCDPRALALRRALRLEAIPALQEVRHVRAAVLVEVALLEALAEERLDLDEGRGGG